MRKIFSNEFRKGMRRGMALIWAVIMVVSAYGG